MIPLNSPRGECPTDLCSSWVQRKTEYSRRDAYPWGCLSTTCLGPLYLDLESIWGRDAKEPTWIALLFPLAQSSHLQTCEVATHRHIKQANTNIPGNHSKNNKFTTYNYKHTTLRHVQTYYAWASILGGCGVATPPDFGLGRSWEPQRVSKYYYVEYNLQKNVGVNV